MHSHVLKTSVPSACLTWLRPLALAIGAAFVSGCATVAHQEVAPGESSIVIGPKVRDNRTPLETSFACLADKIATLGGGARVIGVGDIKDYTGKYSINEGNAITQGGALMVYSALGKLTGAVGIAERFDPSIAERELAYTDRRQLGDGKAHVVPDGNGGQHVPWIPYFGGSIIRSDYFIVGGITELNYNLRSGGAEFQLDQIGPKARTYTESVGVDLRIVDSRSLLVKKTVSLTKQFVGYEVGFNVFRFFDNELFDVNLGAEGQEPLQLGIRTALEEGVIRLVSAIADIEPSDCLALRQDSRIADESAERLRTRPNPTPDEPTQQELRTSARTVNLASASGAAAVSGVIQIPFEFGDTLLKGATTELIDRIAAAAKQAAVDVTLVARDTENWDPARRDDLINQRIAAVSTALANRGVGIGAIRVVWRPDPADTSIHRDGPGLQELAKLRIGG